MTLQSIFTAVGVLLGSTAVVDAVGQVAAAPFLVARVLRSR